MKLDEFRHRMELYRRDADREAARLKDSYQALEMLHNFYQRFDAEERVMADLVIGEWALSEDENVRFDALVLIDDFKIKKALGALRALADRLMLSREPSAPYELDKVNRIVGELA